MCALRKPTESESTQPVPLNELARQIREEHEAVEATGRAAKAANDARSAHAIQAGRLLIQAKKQVDHGEWLAWLVINCKVKHRSAQLYMQLATKHAEMDTAKAQRVAHLSLRQALRETAEPKPTEGLSANLINFPAPASEGRMSITATASKPPAEIKTIGNSDLHDAHVLAALRTIAQTDTETFIRVSKLDSSVNYEDLSAILADAAVLAVTDCRSR